jgi:hypothetical protein
MTSYQEMLSTGDNKDKDIVAGDATSYLLQVIQGTPIPDPAKAGEELIGVMPPKGHLKPEVFEAFRRWILMGMPQTVGDAGKLTLPTLTPTPKP